MMNRVRRQDWLVNHLPLHTSLHFERRLLLLEALFLFAFYGSRMLFEPILIELRGFCHFVGKLQYTP
jgi:hypothetical protein